MAENAVENKVEFGLKNAHYAIVTDTGTELQYGDVKVMPGATEISVDAEGDSNDFYADNTKYYTAVSNQGYSGKLTIARVTDEFMQDVFGEIKDETSGLQVDNTDVQPKAIALMFEFDGDRKKTRHVLFNVTATRPSIGSSTKSDKIEPNTSELAFTASPDPYAARSKAKANQGDTSYDSFYDAVPVPGTAPKA
jgi:phi13 family phage major tail protein